MSDYKLCEGCTVRNCHRTPVYVEKLHAYRCRKMRPINDKITTLGEEVLYKNPVHVMNLAHKFNLAPTTNKKGQVIFVPKGA